MELTTLDRKFLPVSVIDSYESLIWTERYYGDSEVQLVVPAIPANLQKLSNGTFLKLDESNEIMIIETHDIKDKRATITGISLLKWLNNRVIRVTPNHEDRYYTFSGLPPGALLWFLINVMVASSDPAFSTFPAGIPNPERFKIYNIEATHFDSSGENITVAISYGPLYDALYSIATTYGIGMTLTLIEATDINYRLGFSSYKGTDRTSGQSVNPVVRFSPDLESFSDIKELQSISDYKTEVYTFAPANPGGLATLPGYGWFNLETGFDLRMLMTFEEDITTDLVGSDWTLLYNILIYRAIVALISHRFARFIDGTVIPTGQYKYGANYTLGDIIEVQGHSGIIQSARVIEYIRSKDNIGETAYPTLEMIG